jgi:hypothetical protein
MKMSLFFLQLDLLKSHEVMLGWGVVLQMKMSLFFFTARSVKIS